MSIPKTIEWIGGPDGFLRLIDQTQLPAMLTYRDCRTVEDVWEAIKSLRVRGAPAIGVAAAFGVVVGVQSCPEDDFQRRLDEVAAYLGTSRPTAVNLFWALKRMRDCGRNCQGVQRLLEESLTIQEEDRRMCQAIGRAGVDLIRDGAGVLTHCNTGGAGDRRQRHRPRRPLRGGGTGAPLPRLRR